MHLRALRLTAAVAVTGALAFAGAASADTPTDKPAPTAAPTALPGKAPKGYAVVNTPFQVAPTGAQSTAHVECPVGTVPLGGGVFIQSNDTAANINSSAPTPTGWSGWVNNTSGATTFFQVQAICAKKPTRYSVVDVGRERSGPEPSRGVRGVPEGHQAARRRRLHHVARPVREPVRLVRLGPGLALDPAQPGRHHDAPADLRGVRQGQGLHRRRRRRDRHSGRDPDPGLRRLPRPDRGHRRRRAHPHQQPRGEPELDHRLQRRLGELRQQRDHALRDGHPGRRLRRRLTPTTLLRARRPGGPQAARARRLVASASAPSSSCSAPSMRTSSVRTASPSSRSMRVSERLPARFSTR